MSQGKKEKHSIRNVEIDMLRAISILLVLWHHGGFHGFNDGIPSFLRVGWQGVELFFVISGFVISQSLLPRLDKALSSRETQERISAVIITVKAFFVRRFFRLFPVCWTWIFIYIGLSIFFNQSESFGDPLRALSSMVWIAVYGMNYAMVHHYADLMGQHWSLSIEEQFYFLYPVFLCFVISKKRRALAFIGYFLAVAFIIRPLFYIEPEAIRYSTIVKIDSIMIGCLIYFMSTEKWFRNLVPETLTKMGLRVSFVLLVLFFMTPMMLPPDVAHPAINVVAGIFVFLAAFEKGIIFPFGKVMTPVFEWIGKRSYIIYLVQFACFFSTKEIWFRLSKAYGFQLDSSYIYLYQLTAYGLILITTELTHQLIEKPSLRKGRKFSEKIEGLLDSNQSTPIPQTYGSKAS